LRFGLATTRAPEFKLERPEHAYDSESSYPSLAYSDLAENPALASMSLDDAIEHFGVKGMRWGQRKTETVTVGGKTKLVTPKKAAKLDSKWEKNQYTLPKALERHNAMADHVNARVGALNDKFKDHDFSKEDWGKPSSWSPKFKEYNDAFGKLTEEGYHKAVAKEGLSPTGKKQTVVEGHGDNLRVVVKNVAAKHAAIDSEDESFLFRVSRNASGLITKVEPVEDSMAQTEELGAEFMEHHGVKGMKWGVSKAKSGAKAVGRGAGALARFAGDVNFENKAHDSATEQRIVGMAHKAYKKQDVPRINAKPEYQAAKKLKTRLRNPRDPVVKQYRQEHRTAYIKQLEKAANAHTNASGTRQYTIRERGDELPARGGDLPKSKYSWEVSSRPIKSAAHAASPLEMTTVVEVILDNDGFIVDLKPPATAVAQSAMSEFESRVETGADFLEHFGVKGMRWGIRRLGTPPMPVTTTTTVKVPHGNRRKTKIKVEGGQNQPAHEDAIKVAEVKARLKKSGPAALSNQELREVANRVQLENQVAILTSSKGKQFVSRQFEKEGQTLTRAGIRGGVSKGAEGAKKAKKGLATAATIGALA
jgi:hypothetical protein